MTTPDEDTAVKRELTYDELRKRYDEGVARGERMKAALDQMTADRDKWREAKRQDREAEALDGCVRALDALKGGQDNYRMATSSVFERILRYLAARYGVAWPEPCRHRDSEQEAEILMNLEGQIRYLAEQVGQVAGARR